ncbi:MAG: radical SAM protein [Candidatus Cloacimonetes bacterium]|nr:radical SAM protein [Candidatus Cloacimonadota bacterium]
MLKIAEIFHSLQGESTYAGLPCIFIRLSGCNLNCSYCDTGYALGEGTEWSVEQILDKIRQYQCNLVELTGGEPLCQTEAIQLLQRLCDEGYTVLLETNGSISVAEVPPEVIKIIDVKLPSSGYGESFLTENLRYLQTHDQIKFVMGDKRDYETAKDFIAQHGLKGGNILFSPVSDKLKAGKLAEWVLQDSLDVRLQIQLHKILDIK